jgi:hypothetical protein
MIVLTTLSVAHTIIALNDIIVTKLERAREKAIMA